MRYMIAPLELDDDQTLIYKRLYEASDFNTGEVKFTIKQISDSFKNRTLGRKKIENTLAYFEELGLFKITKKGRAGANSKPSEGIIFKVKDIEKSEELGTIKEQIRNNKGTIESVENTKVNDVKEQLKNNKGALEVQPIQRIKNKEINIYSRVITRLNELTGKNYRYTTKKTQTCIASRLKEGFVEDDFYKVMEIKCKEWLGTDMDMYLRPETLFGAKFEGYLNQNQRQQIIEQPREKKTMEIQIGNEIEKIEIGGK